MRFIASVIAYYIWGKYGEKCEFNWSNFWKIDCNR